MKSPGDISIGYGRNQPLHQLASVLFVNSVVLLLISRLARNRHYPTTPLTDLVLLGIGTHKLSRLVAKDRVTAPLRAPFTQFEKSAGSGEVEESARGTGWQAVMGELVSCPYCMSVWVATGLISLWLMNRRLARLICGWLASITASHFLHRFYMRLEPE